MKLRIKADAIDVHYDPVEGRWYAVIPIEDDDRVEMQLVAGNDEVVERARIKADSRTGLDLVHV